MNKHILSVNFSKCSGKSTIASNRIAVFIGEQLDCQLVDTRERAVNAIARRDTYEAVFVTNGLWAFCDFRKEVELLAKRAKRLYWCANDYAIKMPGPLKKLPHVRIATFDNTDAHPAHVYLNWNQLTHGPSAPPVKIQRGGVFYWGAFREGRIPSFRRYFGQLATYPITVSTTPKNKPKYQNINQRITVVDGHSIDPQVTPGEYQATVYIEDEASHHDYHSPANRFYEALAAGTLILFCRSTLNTWRRAGIDVSPWVVSGPDDVTKALANSQLMLVAQQKALHVKNDYRQLLAADFRAFTRAHLGV